MKLIIYCGACGILIPSAMKRGECCSACREGRRSETKETENAFRSFRRPNTRIILETIRREVRLPAAQY